MDSILQTSLLVQLTKERHPSFFCENVCLQQGGDEWVFQTVQQLRPFFFGLTCERRRGVGGIHQGQDMILIAFGIVWVFELDKDRCFLG